jgi:hypothetical protein
MRGKEGQGLCCISVTSKLIENTGFLIGNLQNQLPLLG